jgi:hypothetical protein
MLDIRVSLFSARAAVVGFAMVVGLMGCNPNSIGRVCVDPTNTSVSSGAKIASPALECPSRLCLIEPSTTSSSGAISTCTAECGSNSDCEAETKESCAAGYVCAVATQVGNFCCQKLCICRDSLTPGFNEDDSTPPKIITPVACTPGQSTCSNVKQ